MLPPHPFRKPCTTPQAYKYVPFGSVDEALPYLIRRAQENSDMLGGVGKEMKMMRQELRRRMFG